MSACSVEVVTTTAGLAELGSAYAAVNAASHSGLPFAQHEWHSAWWRHLAQAEGPVRDELHLIVVRDERGDCAAIVPLVSTVREMGYFETRTLGLLGSDPNLTELPGPIVRPRWEAAVAQAVAKHLRAYDVVKGWDWIHWSGISGEFGRELANSAVLTPSPPRIDYVLDLPPTWDAFRAHLKRNVRESLRHCYNSLKREGLTFELSVAEEPEAVRSALPMFLSLHAQRAGLGEAAPHPDRFETASCRDFLWDVCEGMAARGAVRVFLLSIRGSVVAARIAFVFGGELYLYYSGFDPRWRKYSVSTTLVAEATRYAIERGLVAVNLSPGTDVSKTRWGPRAVLYPEAFQIHQSVRSRVTLAAYRHLMDGNRPRWLTPILDRLPKREWM